MGKRQAPVWKCSQPCGPLLSNDNFLRLCIEKTFDDMTTVWLLLPHGKCETGSGAT